MLDLYLWTTPNSYKVLLLVEEAEIPHIIKPINLARGDQFQPEFLRISPNSRAPAAIDYAPAHGEQAISIFESGAILLYLAEKIGRFIPSDLGGRVETLQWLFWQMAALGPTGGQNHHFAHAAPEKAPYAIQRFANETARLYGVLERRLVDRDFIAGPTYTIADMAIYPWIVPHERQGQNIAEFPRLRRWLETVSARPATARAYAKGKLISTAPQAQR